MRTLPYLLCILVFVADTRSQAQDELLMVQCLTRHADRAGSGDAYITAVAPLVFFRGLGELTNDGLSHATATGAAYKARYGSFIDQRLKPNEIDIVASSVDRVLMSAGHFSSGLFRTATNMPVHGPIYTKPYPDDLLLAAQFDCVSGWDDLIEKYDLPDSDDIAPALLSAMRKKEWECDQPPAEQSDTLLSENTNPLTKIFLSAPQKACAEDKARKFMYNFLENLGGGGKAYSDQSAERFQRTIGQLSKAIASNFTMKSECYKKHGIPDKCDVLKKARFFYSHDVNVLALLNVISAQRGAGDFYKGNNPAFSSSITLELWGRGGNATYVKAFVRDGDGAMFEDFRYCDYLPANFTRVDGYCTPQSLERAIAMYITDEEPLCIRKPDLLPSCCPPLGVWSEWTTTGDCATTCGSYSTATRTRECLSQVDKCPCTGESSDVGPCGTALCPLNPQCSDSYNSSMNGNTLIKFCGHGDTPAVITDCSPANCCPSGGIWSEWAPEDTCPTTCGSCSVVRRTRTCVSAKDGCKCSGSSTGYGPCNTLLCEWPYPICCPPFSEMYDNKTQSKYCGKIDDVEPSPPKVPCCPKSAPTYWSEWGEWSNTCQTKGGKTKTRVCHGLSKGCPCKGESTESQPCCCPSGGIWGEWTGFNDPDICSPVYTCGGCKSIPRTRICESEKFGCPCAFASTYSFGSCNRVPCPGPTGQCCPGSGGVVLTNPNTGVSYCGTHGTDIPLSSCCANGTDSTWGEWSEWSGSDCKTAKCGLCDILKRSRICYLGPKQCPCGGEPTAMKGCGANKLCTRPDPIECCEPSEVINVGGEKICG